MTNNDQKNAELTIERVRELAEEATPGPWAWRGEPSRGNDNIAKAPYLRSEVSPRYIVLDSEREGMQGSTLRFRIGKPSIMRKVSELGPTWRQHADAALIAAAPDLARLAIDLHDQLQQEREAREKLERLEGFLRSFIDGDHLIRMFEEDEAALAAAKAQQ